MSSENDNEENGNGNGTVQFQRKDGVEKDGYICFPVEPSGDDKEVEKEEHKEEITPEKVDYILETCQEDPRYQQMNKTFWCFRMYVDYHRCRLLLGEKAGQCNYFYKCYNSICPNAWHEKWDEQREKGNFPWDFSSENGRPPRTPCP